MEFTLDGIPRPHPGLGTMAAPIEGDARPVLAELFVRSGVGGVDRFSVCEATVRMGRAPDNGVVLVAPSVSPEHAELTLRGGLWTLRDLGSVTGSLVDGVAVQDAALLAPGSDIRLGEVRLAFDPRDRWEDSPIERAREEAVATLPAVVAEPVATVGHMPVRELRFREASTPFVIMPESESGSRRVWLVAVAVVVAMATLLYFFLKAR
jgi:Inner membrane component of T3SS, cytoplasmic domain